MSRQPPSSMLPKYSRKVVRVQTVQVVHTYVIRVPRKKNEYQGSQFSFSCSIFLHVLAKWVPYRINRLHCGTCFRIHALSGSSLTSEIECTVAQLVYSHRSNHLWPQPLGCKASMHSCHCKRTRLLSSIPTSRYLAPAGLKLLDVEAHGQLALTPSLQYLVNPSISDLT